MLRSSELGKLFPTEMETSAGRGADDGKGGWRRNLKDKGIQSIFKAGRLLLLLSKTSCATPSNTLGHASRVHIQLVWVQCGIGVTQ